MTGWVVLDCVVAERVQLGESYGVEFGPVPNTRR